MPFPTTDQLEVPAWPGTNGTAIPAPPWQSPFLQDAGTISQAGTNTVKASATASAGYTLTMFGADQEVWIPITTLVAANNWIQLLLRVSNTGSSNPDAYILKITLPTPNTGNATWEIRKKLAGGSSTLISTPSTTTALAAGDSIGFQAIGSSLSAWKKPSAGSWAQIGASGSDSSITAQGYIGFSLFDTTGRGGAPGGGTYRPLPDVTIARPRILVV
jgi:hypothetical protein